MSSRRYRDRTYEDFRVRHPWITDSDIVDWYRVGSNTIVVILEDRTRMYFNDMTKCTNIIKRENRFDEGCISEGDWKREFAIVLARKINEFGLTQKELAIISNVSQTTISNCLNGKTNPTAYLLLRLARGLGCSISELTEFD